MLQAEPAAVRKVDRTDGHAAWTGLSSWCDQCDLKVVTRKESGCAQVGSSVRRHSQGAHLCRGWQRAPRARQPSTLARSLNPCPLAYCRGPVVSTAAMRLVSLDRGGTHTGVESVAIAEACGHWTSGPAGSVAPGALALGALYRIEVKPTFRSEARASDDLTGVSTNLVSPRRSHARPRRPRQNRRPWKAR